MAAPLFHINQLNSHSKYKLKLHAREKGKVFYKTLIAKIAGPHPKLFESIYDEIINTTRSLSIIFVVQNKIKRINI